MSIKKTYLRYECADSFALTCDASPYTSINPTICAFLPPTSSSSWSSSSVALFCSSSQIVGFDVHKGQASRPCIKLGHRQATNIGTGRALNSDNVTCLDISAVDSSTSNSAVNVRIATGWNDGAVRIFDIYRNELEILKGRRDGGGGTGYSNSNLGVVHSLLDGPRSSSNSGGEEEFAAREPLVLNGHSGSPVQCVKFDDHDGGRLASGGADGAVVVWDIIAETGLFRLLGHRGAISHVSFVRPQGLYIGPGDEDKIDGACGSLDGLVSSCLDGLVKVWDLNGQCCIQTLTGHGSEVWSADCACVDREVAKGNGEEDRRRFPRWRLVTGTSDARLRLWGLYEPRRESAKSGRLVEKDEDGLNKMAGDGDGDREASPTAIYMGSITRQTNERVSHIKFHRGGSIFGVLAHGSKSIEVYAVWSWDESRKRRSRRLKRRREKASRQEIIEDSTSNNNTVKKKEGGVLNDDCVQDNDDDGNFVDNGANDSITHDMIKASDELVLIGVVRSAHKIKGFCFHPKVTRSGGCQVVLALGNNSVEVYSVSRKPKEGEPSTHQILELDLYGHSTGIRSISLSSDEMMACTISKGMMKIWNVRNRACIRSVPLYTAKNEEDGKTKRVLYGLCCAFIPGNVHVTVGTKEGTLQLIDFASGEIVCEEKNAHQGAIWTLDIRSDGESIITGSADNQVKFWTMQMDKNSKKPCLVHARTLKMNDDVVAVRYSYSMDPAKRLIAVSTLDSTIKIFFEDSLKFFLSLYGHKLPALALDCSDDDSLLASGGADKVIKIWGLDFGDTHRTLHGHRDSVTDLKFVKKTHLFFTCSRDKTIRFWDGDRFDQILLLEGHAAEVNTIALSKSGAFLLTGSMDRQVRVWERTKDIVFVEEEKERELEKIFERVDGSKGDTAARVEFGFDEDEEDIDATNRDDVPHSEAAVKRSVLAVTAGDRIMEAIELADQELKELTSTRKSEGGSQKIRLNPLLLGLQPAEYVLWVLRTIKSSELEQSLLVLPINHMERLSYYLIVLLRAGKGAELCSKVAVFIVTIHNNHIFANQFMAIPIRELEKLIKLRIGEARDMIGYNLAGLRVIARLAKDKRDEFIAQQPTEDVWAGLGLGSDVAAALQSKKNKRQKI